MKFSDDLARLWRLTGDSRRGRPPELDVARVVDAAVELADSAGLAGVSLPKIAEALGVTPMSLYRHIGSKAELLVLMGDAAQGPAPDLPPGWRSGLREWACAQLGGYRRRPWLAQLPVSSPPRGPTAIAWMDAGLRTLRGTGMEWGAKVGVLAVVSGYVRQTALLAQQLEQGRRASGMDQPQTEHAYGREMASIVDPARFPEAAALFDSGVFDYAPGADETPDGDFGFGLKLILDGVAESMPS